MLRISEMLLILFIGILLGAAFQYTWLIGNFFNDWQTLIAGLLALSGACLTIMKMQKQLDIDHQKHKDQIERKSFAVRSQMPDALSALTAYTEECFNYLFERREEIPTPPTEHIAIFKNSLEFVDNQSSKMIFELVSFYQVHNARLRNYEHVAKDHPNYVQAILDTTELNFYISRIFKYARNQTDKIPSEKETYDDMESSLRTIAGGYKFYSRLHELEDVMTTLRMMYIQVEKNTPPNS